MERVRVRINVVLHGRRGGTTVATIDESTVASVSSARGACRAACRLTVSDAPWLG